MTDFERLVEVVTTQQLMSAERYEMARFLRDDAHDMDLVIAYQRLAASAARNAMDGLFVLIDNKGWH